MKEKFEKIFREVIIRVEMDSEEKIEEIAFGKMDLGECLINKNYYNVLATWTVDTDFISFAIINFN